MPRRLISLAVLIGLHPAGFGSSCALSRAPCVLCSSREVQLTEGEVRKCSCWVCTSQSRVGGEYSSLLAGRRAGRDRQGVRPGRAGGRGRHAGSWCRRHGYLDTFPACRWEVLGICIGSAGLPRLASCKCLLSPSDYCQAELGGMFRALRCDAARLYQCGSTELCQLCPRVLFTSRSRGLVSRYPGCSRPRFYGNYLPR